LVAKTIGGVFGLGIACFIFAWWVSANSPIDNALAECRYEVTWHGHSLDSEIFTACMESRGFILDPRAKSAQELAKLRETLPPPYNPSQWRFRGWARLTGHWSR
jgi:hypothetical protein